MTEWRPDRRTVVLAGGSALVALAGCLSDGGSDIDPDAPPEEQVDQHLDGANMYDGDIVDYTDESSVTVANGNISGFAFDPPAIRISTGTTVTWEWVDSAPHSVTHHNGDAFDSGIESGEGTTFEHTFENTGAYHYICRPHDSVQRGSVLVE